MAFWRLFVCGLCIGAADLIPGISGGTIAIVLGVYEPLLAALQAIDLSFFKRLFAAEWRSAYVSVPWSFLGALALGIGVALISFVQLIHFLLSEPTYRSLLYAAFMGLVLSSVTLMRRRMSQWTPWRFLVCLCSMGGAALITSYTAPKAMNGPYAIVLPDGVAATTPSAVNYAADERLLMGLSLQEVEFLFAKGIVASATPLFKEGLRIDKSSLPPHGVRGLDLWAVICGIICICAALLPGISGSYCLNVLGMYGAAIGALSDFSSSLSRGAIAVDSFQLLLSLAIGIIIGATAFARAIKWALDHYRDSLLATMVGFMVGTLGSVWPFWSTAFALQPTHLDKGPQLIFDHPLLPSVTEFSSWSALFCGIAAYSALQLLEKRSRRKTLNATL